MWTYPPRRLLVAVDFGEASTRALRVAGEIAHAYGARLTALHAETFEAPPYFTSDQVQTIEEQRRVARRDAVQYLAHTASKLAGMEVETIVADGAAADAILHASRDYDLIVMGTHGRRGPARWWAGSVAERVAREATMPVLIVRAGNGPPAEVFRSIATVAPGGVFDDPARRYARGLATQFKGAYTADSATSPEDDVAQDATLVVIAQPAAQTSVVAAGAAERALRTCRRPVLLVPPV